MYIVSLPQTPSRRSKVSGKAMNSSSNECQPSRWPLATILMIFCGTFFAAFSACIAVSPSAVQTMAETLAAL